MIRSWRAWLRRKAAPRVPEDIRVYAIGDVHGEIDLLRALLARISVDSGERSAKTERVIFVGDLIDRGANSASILCGLYALRHNSSVTVLLGNHEETMLAAYDGNKNALGDWLLFGGIQTLASFGVDASVIDLTDLDRAEAALRQHVPLEIIVWLRSLPTTARIGDYLFVHAGIRPGVQLDRQKRSDLLWIRREFLDSEKNHGVVVVHGHSISQQVDFRNNRIGIDTGAYQSGMLSALVLEGENQWVLNAFRT